MNQITQRNRKLIFQDHYVFLPGNSRAPDVRRGQ